MSIFSEPQKAAKNINVLLEYLQNEESGRKYIYRGQTRNWPGPLLPSVYRRSIQGSTLYNDKSKEYKQCPAKSQKDYERTSMAEKKDNNTLNDYKTADKLTLILK